MSIGGIHASVNNPQVRQLLMDCFDRFDRGLVGSRGTGMAKQDVVRVEVGDLTTQSLEEVWTGPRYVALRKKLVEEQLFPVCRRCCKVELSAEPAGAPEAIPADPELAALGAN